MSQETEGPAGPDLAAGVASEQIAEGGMLVGHVDGDAVLVARTGGRCYAVGAACTHYGGPLPAGIIVGDMVRCPWHHAAFNLRTGAMERPPALDDLPCWRVEEAGGRVRVLERTPAAAAAGGRGVGGPLPESVVIIGAGAAGTTAAETLRREGYTGRLTMIEADPDEPVDRPNLSKDYLAGNASEDWIPLRPPDYFRDHGITLLRERRATELDVRGRRVRLDDGREIGYDALLLATGASPVRLPLPGSARIPLLYLRTLADSRTIIRAAEQAGAGGRAVVIGASFIGLEVAASLRARGLEAHVVAPESRPLERVMGPELGDFVRRLHEEHGVVFHLGQTARERRDDGVVLENGELLPADFVVAGVGVRPNVELAERAGLALDRGILVNDRLETSAPGVFAAGDIARWPDAHTGERIRVEHWVLAERQARTAGRNLLGAGERFDGVPFFWSAHYDVSIRYVGHAERWDAIEIDGSPAERDCAATFRAGGRTLAVATIGRDHANLEAEVAMERETAMAVAAH